MDAFMIFPVICNAEQPVLTQTEYSVFEQRWVLPIHSTAAIRGTKAIFASMRFLEFDPEAMRRPSPPSQTTLGDRGENLSSVLQAIYQNEAKKAALIDWIRELTPMDATALSFENDLSGKVLVGLVEKNGQKTLAYSASDGTLRFLAMLAALLNTSKKFKLYFFEEIENGLHPARLFLLLQLVEQQVAQSNIQILATTHSPQVLRLLSKKSREYASLVYRVPNSPAGRIVRLTDIPEAAKVLEKQDWARLFESGWFENVIFFNDKGDEQ